MEKIKKELEKIKTFEEKIKYLESLLKKTRDKKTKAIIKEVLEELKQSLEAKVEAPKAKSLSEPSKPEIGFKEIPSSTFETTKYEIRTAPGRSFVPARSPLEESLKNVEGEAEQKEYGIKIPDYSAVQNERTSSYVARQKQVQAEVPTIVSRVRESLINRGVLSQNNPLIPAANSRTQIEELVRNYAPGATKEEVQRYTSMVMGERLRERQIDKTKTGNYEKHGVLE